MKINDVHFRDEAFEFRFPFSAEQRDFVKLRLKAFYREDERDEYWRLSRNRADFALVNEYVDQFSPHVSAAANAILLAGYGVSYADQASYDLSMATDADLSDYDLSALNVTPFPFQRSGALYLTLKRRALLADDMGLGKTIQALMALHMSGAADKFIVICPATIKIGWRRQIEKILPNCTAAIWDAKGGSSDVNCVIINYENLKKQIIPLGAFGAKALICDEFHKLKSATAQRSQMVATLSRGVDVFYGLTGTPLLSRPSELAPLLALLGRLDEFGGWNEYVKRYCAAYLRTIWVKPKNSRRAFQKRIWDTSGAANLNELNRRLRECCMIRRTKTEVLPDLPKKLRSQVVLPIDNRKEYDHAQQNLTDYLRACAAVDEAFLKQISYMTVDEKKEAIIKHQDDAAKSAEKAEQLVMIETLRSLAAHGKLAGVVDWIKDFLESDEKLVVFATHVAIQHALAKAFPGISSRIFAEDSSVKKQAAIDRFVSDDNCRLIVCSLGAAGVGVDELQKSCSNGAFIELGWTPAEILQAEDRLQRIGQQWQVNWYYLIGENTIDETMQTLLAKKQAICESVLDGAPETKEQSIFNELIEVMRK